MLRETLARLESRLPKWSAPALVLTIVLAVYVVTQRRGPYSDEIYHYPSIVDIALGKYQVHPALTTLPGYHYFCGFVSRMLGHHGLGLVRSFTIPFGLLVVWAAARLAKSARPPPGRFAVAQTFLLPLALPYFVLCYTDIPSLALVLLGVWLWLSDRKWAATTVLTLSMAVRQTNVVWLLFVAGYSVFSDGLFDYSLTHVTRLLKRVWPALIGMSAFGAFVWINGGVAVGSTEVHHVQPNLGNIYFGLFVYFFLFIPTNLSVLWKNRGELGDLRLWLIGAAVFAIYQFGYRVESPYNHIPSFLRNDILMFFEREEMSLAFFVPVMLSVAVLYWTPLRTPGSYAIYPATALLLLPDILIEHRYYIAPFALLTLLRSHEDDAVEAMTTAVCAGLSAYFVHRIGFEGLSL